MNPSEAERPIEPGHLNPGEWEPDHLSDDQALDLLHGLFDAARESALVRHLEGCPRCEARFRQLAGTHERGRARAAALIAAGADGGSLRLVPGDPDAPHRRRRGLSRGTGFTIGLGLAAAAAIAVLLLPRLWQGRAPLLPHPLTQTETGWLPDPQMDITLRAEGAGLGDSLQAGLTAYARRDLAAAGRLLALPVPEGTADDVRRIYLADVELRLRHPQAALTALNDLLLDAVPQPWRDQGHWTLVHALDALGRRAAADSVLRVLAIEPGATGEAARAALRRRPPMQ